VHFWLLLFSYYFSSWVFFFFFALFCFLFCYLSAKFYSLFFFASIFYFGFHQMAVVTRADCTEIDVDETFQFTYSKEMSQFSGVLVDVGNIDFNACQGKDGNNNDLDSYFERLVDEQKQTPENLASLRQVLVGTGQGQCNQAILDFMGTKGIGQESVAAAAADTEADMTTKGTKEENTVDVVDIAYEHASEGGDGALMPAVPSSPEEGNDEATVIESAQAEFAEDEEVASTPQLLPDDEVSPDEPSLLDDGAPCNSGLQCMSGKCLGSGICGKTKYTGAPLRRRAQWWK